MEPITVSPLLDNGQPAVSCYALSIDELVRRQNRAHQRAEAQARAEQATPAELLSICRATLWHEEFPAGLRLYVCDNSLFRLTADLPGELLVANGGQPLDFHDYGYVADVLREWLADEKYPISLLLLGRALAWVQEEGERKRDFSLE